MFLRQRHWPRTNCGTRCIVSKAFCFDRCYLTTSNCITTCQRWQGKSFLSSLPLSFFHLHLIPSFSYVAFPCHIFIPIISHLPFSFLPAPPFLPLLCIKRFPSPLFFHWFIPFLPLSPSLLPPIFLLSVCLIIICFPVC